MIYLAHAIEQGLVLVSDDLTGVAAMLPPDCPDPSESLQAEIAELMGDRLQAMLGVGLPQRPAGSWDLATIGVLPQNAGQGLGSLIIDESLTRAAASSFPRVSLETSAERNVTLYERHGFVVCHRTEIENGPTVYTMNAVV